MTIALLEPSPALLPSYAAALEAGWSPNTMRDVSGEQLQALRADPEGFLKDLLDPNSMVDLGGGNFVPKLPSYLFWLSDGDFCGSINFRFQRGSEELPAHCSGHIGYSIVPWKQRRGYATEALRQVLDVVRKEGFSRISLTCDADNIGSIKVITTNGGVVTHRGPNPDKPGKERLTYWIKIA